MKKKTTKRTVIEFWKDYGFEAVNDVFNAVLENIRTGVIVVHDGTEFHTDEVRGIAVASLVRDKLIKQGEDIPVFKIIRTRDKDILLKAKENNWLVLDVGEGYLDHHMPLEVAAFRETGEQYAAAGLIWAACGSFLCDGLDSVAKKIDRAIFLPGDNSDTGVDTTDFLLEEYCSPSCLENESNLMSEMMYCIEVEKHMISRAIRHMVDAYKLSKIAEEEIASKLPDAEQTGIIVLSRHLPWKEILIPTKVKIVIVDRTDKEGEDKWTATVVPIAPNTFKSKINFPIKMNGNVIAGLRGEELRKATGISGLNFLHSGAWFATSSDFESIMQLAKYTIANC